MTVLPLGLELLPERADRPGGRRGDTSPADSKARERSN